MKNLWTVLIFGAVTALGLLGGYHLTHQPFAPDSAHLKVAVPATLDELVDSSDLIVIGRLGQVVNQEIFYGYDKGAQERRLAEAETGIPAGLPIIDYQLIPDQVLADNRFHRGPIIIRLFRDHDPQLREMDLINPQIGEQRMFCLTLNPDGHTYGLATEMHWFWLDGPYVTYPSENREKAAFDTQMDPATFVEAIAERVAR